MLKIICISIFICIGLFARIASSAEWREVRDNISNYTFQELVEKDKTTRVYPVPPHLSDGLQQVVKIIDGTLVTQNGSRIQYRQYEYSPEEVYRIETQYAPQLEVFLWTWNPVGNSWELYTPQKALDNLEKYRVWHIKWTDRWRAHQSHPFYTAMYYAARDIWTNIKATARK